MNDTDLPIEPPRALLCLGEWRVEASTGRLSRGDRDVQLEPRVMSVLVYLAQHSDRVVSKQELLDSVWGDVSVTDDVLWRCISRLRRVLGDDPRRPRFIETLPRRGYRIVAPVSFSPPREAARFGARQGRSRLPAAIGLALVVLGVAWTGLLLTRWLRHGDSR